jgi:hypothetical protein
VAFTNAERVKIRIDLGWPGTSNWDSSLESAIDAAGADADITTEVQTVLARIDTIEAEIAGCTASRSRTRSRSRRSIRSATATCEPRDAARC